MSYVYLNDQSHTLTVHPGSCTKKLRIAPGESITINIPYGTTPFIKSWDKHVILLSYMGNSTVSSQDELKQTYAMMGYK